jgi:hypothetical protein
LKLTNDQLKLLFGVAALSLGILGVYFKIKAFKKSKHPAILNLISEIILSEIFGLVLIILFGFLAIYAGLRGMFFHM